MPLDVLLTAGSRRVPLVNAFKRALAPIGGRVITTAVATAIITDDGRVAAGAVPEQVLTEALAK